MLLPGLFFILVYLQKVTSVLTVRCWNSHALMMLVATLGKMPRFFCLFLSLSGSSSSPVPGDATLLSKPSPGRKPNPGLNNIPDHTNDSGNNKKNLDLKVKAQFKAHERWINGQILQIPMKEFQSITAAKPVLCKKDVEVGGFRWP